MKVKNIEQENFVNYKLPSMTIGFCYCDFKCCHESNIPESVCINHDIINQSNIEISFSQIYNLYINNPITQAIVLAGMEPLLQFDDIFNLIKYFRDQKCNDMFVIYTGYYSNEIEDKLNKLRQFTNVIIKFGRFIPNDVSRYDDVLGINLISHNQYAEKIS